MPDSINGQVNQHKEMYGKQQLEWLKNALLQSKTNKNINFRIIATGSQVLNPMSPFDCLKHFTKEYNELLSFIQDNEIKGLLFFTGDRHHSEVIKQERKGAYTLYDITSSPLTSGSHKFGGTEKNNPYRVAGIDDIQNYSRVTLTGTLKDRILKVEFIDSKGNVLSNWSINANELK
jgi:alkaline phosphatase D